MIKIDTRQMEKELDKYEKKVKQTDKALKMALNEGVRKGRTEIKRTVAAIYNIKPSRLSDSNKKKGLSLKLATDKVLSAEVDAGHVPLNLADASPKFKGDVVATTIKFKKGKATKGKDIKRSRGQITVEIVKGQRKPLATAFTIGRGTNAVSGQQFITPAIFARGKKGGVRFQFGKPRYPIDGISTISVATAALNTKAQEKVQPVVSQYVEQRIEHHLKRIDVVK